MHCRGIRVTWHTRDVGTPMVRWGTQPGVYTDVAYASYDTYQQQDMCAAPARTTGWISPGTINTAKLRKLQANTKYYYKYGDDVSC